MIANWALLKSESCLLIFLCVFICLYTDMWIHACCMYACVYAFGDQKLTSGDILQVQGLPAVCQIGQNGLPMSFRNWHVSSPWSYKYRPSYLSFSISVIWGLPSSSYSHKTSTLSIKPSPQVPIYCFNSISYCFKYFLFLLCI